MNLNGKYIWAINNADIDVARDLGPTNIKKYWRRISQIKKEVNRQYRDWIPVLTVFVKQFCKTYNNKKVIENMKIRQDVDLEWVSSLFVKLHRSIYYERMDNKDIADITKLVKELMWCLLIWGSNGWPYQNYIWIGGRELINESINKRKSWNGKQIGELLFTVTIADPK